MSFQFVELKSECPFCVGLSETEKKVQRERGDREYRLAPLYCARVYEKGVCEWGGGRYVNERSGYVPQLCGCCCCSDGGSGEGV